MRGHPYGTAGAGGRLGFRRVDFVRVVRDGERCTCEAYGVVHRLPVVRSVSVEMAGALAAQGVPVVIRSTN